MSGRTGKRSISTTAVSRLRADYMRLKKDPVPYIVAEPVPSNLLEWHYVVSGPEESPYHGGLYHGKLVFPAEFPFKPPSIYMMTPNGRFKCHTRLCLSISDYHPDTWNPAWSVSTILTGLLSFMLEKTPTLGSIETSDTEKRNLASRSHHFNIKDKLFCDLFPELEEKSRKIIDQQKRKQEQQTFSGSVGSSGLSISNGRLSSQQLHDRGQAGHGAVTNILVIGGFAAFAFLVQYIVQNIASATD